MTYIYEHKATPLFTTRLNFKRDTMNENPL